MASLSYSLGALNTLKRFHNVTFVVFVEGQDDVVFWDAEFARHGLASYHVKIAGGAAELDKYGAAIVQHDAEIVVARDCDFSDLLETQHDHPRVLYTYGYSIENSICTPDAAAKAVKLLGLSTADVSAEIGNWITELIGAVRPLVTADLASRKSTNPPKILLANCLPYVDRLKCTVAIGRIAKAVTPLKKALTATEMKAAETALAASVKPLVCHIRGHFLLSAFSVIIHRHVRRLRSRNVSIPHDAVFALLLSGSPAPDVSAAERTHMERQIERLRAA